MLALLIEIDSSIGNWEPRGTSTVERLHQLAGLLQSSPRPHAQDIPRDVVGGSEQLGET